MMVITAELDRSLSSVNYDQHDSFNEAQKRGTSMRYI